MTIPKVKEFGLGDRVYVQAQSMWLILVAHVMCPERSGIRPRTITYGDLAVRMGYEDPRAGHTLSRALGIVGEYCKYNDLPPLNVLVVNEITKQPGDNVVVRSGKTVSEEQRAVMKQNWFKIRVPTTGTFRQVWETVFGRPKAKVVRSHKTA